MARGSEIPLAECPNARLPFPVEEVDGKGRAPKQIPEGAPNDNWFDDTFWLKTEAESELEANVIPKEVETRKEVGRRVSPRRKLTPEGRGL